MLNEAEAFTLKNKKYATAADLMTSENSFLNCFRPNDFNLSVRIFNNFVIFTKIAILKIDRNFCEKINDCKVGFLNLVQSMTEILSQEPGEDIIEIVNLLASNRTDELRINYPKAAAKIDKLLQAIQRNSPGKYLSPFGVGPEQLIR